MSASAAAGAAAAGHDDEPGAAERFCTGSCTATGGTTRPARVCSAAAPEDEAEVVAAAGGRDAGSFALAAEVEAEAEFDVRNT